MRSPLVVLLAAVCAIAQEPDEPLFRTNTQLVQVDVVVKAKDVPVKGLTQDDFVILDNNQPQKIAVFSVREVATRATPRELPPGVISNRPVSTTVEPVAATIILIDMLNTASENQAYARQQILRYLDRAGRSEWVAIYTLGLELKILQDYTLDRDKLRAAIQPFKGASPFLPGWARSQTTINGLKIIARHMQGLEGRKKLVWITSVNMPTLMSDLNQGNVNLDDMYNTKKFDPLKAFNASNVAVYPLDPRPGTEQSLMDNGLLPLQQLAEATGGKAYQLQNDLAAGIEEAIEDTDLTYTLGFYPTAVDTSGQAHNIRVNVKRSGVQTRYRTAYATEAARPNLNAKERTGTMNGWVKMPADTTELALMATAIPAPGKPGMVQVSVMVDLSAVKLEQKDGRYQGSLEIGIVPDLDKDKPRGLRQTMKLNFTPEGMAQALEQGVLYQNVVRGFEPNGKPVAKKLHVVVMDNLTGKAGSVRVPLPAVTAKKK